MPGPSPVALFDFDGTLTRRDTLLPFLRHAVGMGRFTGLLARQAPGLLGLLLGLRANYKVKQDVLKAFLEGLPAEVVETLGKTFAEEHLPNLVSPSMVSILRWHQAQGHRCLLVSASLDTYLLPWSRAFSFEGVLCSRLELSAEGRVTGRLLGPNVYGPEKARKVRAYLQQESSDVDYAYGDSRGDEEMLGMAKHAWYRGKFRGLTPQGWLEGNSI